MVSSKLLCIFQLFALISLSSPNPISSNTHTSIKRFSELQGNFKLVTSTQYYASWTSKSLADVSVLSLFNPYHNKTLLLRLVGPGYKGLPLFDITSQGTLSTLGNGPEHFQESIYSTSPVDSGKELQFSPSGDSGESKANLGLKWGYLLTVDDSEVGWMVCDGPHGVKVIKWQSEDADCQKTYIHAVDVAPY